ncbi:MAG: hypothetical protein ACYTGX_15180 [Planctomycetota bacterium]
MPKRRGGASEPLPETAVKLLDFLRYWGAMLGRLGLVIGVGFLVIGVAMAAKGIDDHAKGVGRVLAVVGAIVTIQAGVVVWAARNLKRAQAMGDRKIRPSLLAFAIAGGPFVAVGMLLSVGVVAAHGIPVTPKGLALVGGSFIVFVGVPSVATFALFKYPKVWAALDSQTDAPAKEAGRRKAAKRRR